MGKAIAIAALPIYDIWENRRPLEASGGDPRPEPQFRPVLST
jgi:hypothetical protein